MRLSDVLQGLGRPVVYYPSLNALTGGTNATIFLCNFFQWAGQQRDPDGWIYKTQDEIEAETGLSRREQETARKQLRTAGMLEEARRGIPSRLWYRVDRDALNDAWEQFSADNDGGNVHPVGAQTATQDDAEPTDYQLTEKTAEGTQGLPPPNLLRVREWSEQHGRKR